MMSTLYGVSLNMPVGYGTAQGIQRTGQILTGGSADGTTLMLVHRHQLGPMRQPLRLISVADALGPLALAHIRVRVWNTPYMEYIIPSR